MTSGKNMFRALAATLFVWHAPPAQSQLFYNQKADEQAKAALAEYQATRDAHLAIFKARADALGTIGGRLDEAIVAAIRAERDAAISGVLAEPAPGQAKALESLIDARVRAITGFGAYELRNARNDALVGSLLYRADITGRINGLRPFTFKRVASFDEQQAAVRMGAAHEALRKLPHPDKQFSYEKFCITNIIGKDAAGAPEMPGVTDVAAKLKTVGFKSGDTDRGRLIQIGADLVSVCNAVADVEREAHFRQRLERAGARYRPLRALAGYALPEDVEGPSGTDAEALGGNLTSLKAELDEARKEVNESERRADELKNQKKALEDAVEKGVREKITEQACKLVKLLGRPSGDGTDPAISCRSKGQNNEAKGEKSGAGAATVAAASEGQGNSAVSPGQPSSCGAGITLACARAVAEQLGLASFDRARASVAFEIAGYLSDPDALAKASAEKCMPVGMDGTPENRRICFAEAGLEVLGLLDQARGIAAGRPGQLAELAILITDAQSRVADAEVRAAGLVRRIDNLAGQRQALATELRLLLDAHEKVDPRRDPRGPLLMLARSYDDGRLPYARLADRQQLLKLASFNAREEQATRARYAIADGLLRTTTAATASGLKPEDAARFLAAIGVTTLGISEAVK